MTEQATHAPGEGGVGHSWFTVDLVSAPVPVEPVEINAGGALKHGIYLPVVRPDDHEPAPSEIVAVMPAGRRRDRDGEILVLLAGKG